MAFEVVKQILEVEKEGDELIKKAQTRALDLQNSAKDGADSILEKARKEAEEHYNSVISSCEAEAREAAKPLIEEGVRAKEKVNNIPVELLDKAVNMVIERIVSSHGNS